MPSMKDVRTFKDSTTFTLKEAHLTKKKCVETEKRDIPSSDGLQWWARYHPAGDRDAAKNYISLYVCFNKPVTATYTFAVNNAFFNYTHTYKFKKSPFGVGYYQYASHEKLRPLFRDGKLTITCSIETDIEVPFVLSVPRVFQLFDHVPTDVEIVVGSKKIQVRL
uniref:MATH domain-containing protein n=1 Tax=Panagrellus redivivus TaxID=6233 RepID=A0A7E4V4X4_PANRE